MKLHIDRNADRSIDRAQPRESDEEYLKETLNKVCSPCEFEDFKYWIEEESNYEVFESSNESWINTETLRVISTKTLYQKYLDARESESNQS